MSFFITKVKLNNYRAYFQGCDLVRLKLDFLKITLTDDFQT